MKRVYLDYNSTTFILPEIENAMLQLEPRTPLNPASQHAFGQLSRGILEDCRSKILHTLFPKNYDEYNMIFTSSGSEANNMMVRCFQAEGIAYSGIEHPCVRIPASQNSNSIVLGVTSDGYIDTDALLRVIKSNAIAVVSVIHGNNEFGVVQDIASISKICKEHNVLFHTDACQSMGKIPLCFDNALPDIITISGHKIYAPVGIAALIFRKDLKLTSLIFGGGQEFGLRAGTQNVRGAYGFTLAVENCKAFLPEKYSAISSMRDRIDSAALACGYTVPCVKSDRLPNTTMLLKAGLNNSAEVMRYDIAGIMVSSGSACSSGLYKISPTLATLGISEELGKSSIRVSLGIDTTIEDVDYFISHLHKS